MKDVFDLLKSDEVKTFQKLKWGGGPVAIFGGLAEMNNTNKSTWELHVMTVDKLIGQILPICIIASIASILYVRDLAGLGKATMPLPGIPDP